jgi:ATP-dependent Clp protease ATP-binding subunit ClpA
VELTATPEVTKWLIAKGYSKAYGARPLARTIDEHLKKPLVDALLFGALSRGGKVHIEVEHHSLRFHYTAAEVEYA